MKPAVFLDRDGTLIDDPGYLADPKRVAPLAGAKEALDELRAKGWPLVVVTNQSGVARGFFTCEMYEAVRDRVAALLGPFDAVYACFHHVEGRVFPWKGDCECRKPKAGMILQAANAHDIDLARSVGVGDAISDIGAFREAGVRPFLVRTGKGLATEKALSGSGVTVIDDLRGLAALLPRLGGGR